MKRNRLLAYALVAIPLCGCVTRTSYIDLYGAAAAPADYQRTITITPTTRHINVVGGDTIRFISNGTQFAWTFNVARTVDSFSLNQVAPAGVLDHNVTAYVSPDPKYWDAE